MTLSVERGYFSPVTKIVSEVETNELSWDPDHYDMTATATNDTLGKLLQGGTLFQLAADLKQKFGSINGFDLMGQGSRFC